MPARLTLQSKPLRLSFRKASWLCPRNPLPARRWYTAQARSACEAQSFAYTWLTKTPDEIVPDDVLASLRPIPASLAESGHIPILLVTPSFAPWVDPASPFLEQCVNRFLSDTPNARSLSPFHAVAAIIDRLPDVRGQPGDALISGQGQAQSDSEGISLLFVKAENVQGKATETRRIRSSGTEEPAFVFSVNTNAPDRPAHEVGLRLANTIFINGNENTLFGMRWTYNATSSRLALDQYLNLSNCIIISSANSVHNALRFPLYPVSRRRKVISGMGNILRQVAKSADDAQSNVPMPASSELERELPRYIDEHGIVDQRVSVWALVETPEMDVPTEAGSFQDRVSHSLRAGGKLHHVMSGGGGWGKKQGLLSLDPEISFSEATNREELLTVDQLFEPGAESADPTLGLPPFLSKGFGEDLSTLSQTAKPGDYVQFFVGVEPSEDQDKRPDIAKPQEGSISCQFGVVTGIPEVQTIDGQQKDLVIIPNYFGALSEKAITYQQPIMDVQANEQVFESGTKLNVPGCRVELTLA
ncbi:uncharacterized protein ASPGLDRAFT_33123 [Aspergillus glaucus CBS 516.65]|uniref:FIST domain-containing protein n=1 Tax=Aspergillus glaucus CBS 516.65 TaxID=1160497 RepID=A0A1L9VU36_ASPGL|nr:hypothetical protein ASPGLDRAFT_33123 [Aspergillus glaucus CBS 516.65]OJJ87410.1 hypothetical protein ASPGLDRAFT_33123 [Aspergillus glaucus CBS 516.65]